MVRFCGMRALAHQQRHAHTRTDTDCDATLALDVDGNTIALSTWNVIAPTAVIVTLQRRPAAAALPDLMMDRTGAHGSDGHGSCSLQRALRSRVSQEKCDILDI
jgi:hypothetical protein